ncbi:heavy metal-binding domain-containing protein [Geobacter sp.]|uniref:YbjQ family protein n=1 Tax=Geobacter sp. TaxID=46610 RepID=UPI00261CD61B|nr:heavy metal-binding domain-containing protein [Geobacter sp.]
MTWKCDACGDENQDEMLRCLCGAELDTSEPVPPPPPWKNVILTTAPHLAGFKINKTIDIVTSECVSGVNIFTDLMGKFPGIFSGRDMVAQNILRRARTICLDDLRKEAYTVGANAVIAVDLDYSEFTGGVLFLVANGTAVEVVEEGITT